ncbi:MAG TPA: DMT family transporter, partial [Actinomycetota bacterium]|nr:DMT family transporter [Actinomycetota bacterium]
MQEGRKQIAAELALVAIAAVWGLTFSLVQDAVARIPVMTFLAYRFIPAAVIVGVISRREMFRLTRAGWRAGIVMGVFLTGGYVFQTLGLERTSASHTGFITGLWVVLTPVVGALFFHLRSDWHVWAAAIVSGIGLFLLSGFGGGGRVAGDLLVLMCAISFTFHVFATDRAVESEHVGSLVAVQLGFCGLFSLLIAAGEGDLQVPRAGVVWLALGVTALIASALGFFVQAYAQKEASPSRTALILASEPAFAGLFAYLLKGQSLTLVGWVGAALIMAAIVSVEVLPYLRPVP